MRSLPLLLAVSIVLLGIALGIMALVGQPAGTTITAGPGPTHRGGLPQGHVYAGVTEEPDDINPFTAHGNTARRFVLGLTHEGLLDTDPVTGELRPAVAESFELADDAMSCTFTLRSGIRFSDGTPVTMADVLFGWQLAEAGHLGFGFVNDAYGRVAEATMLDERRLQVRFRERFYAAVRAVGESWLVTQKAFFVDRVGAMCERLGRPVPPIESAEFADLLAQIDRECGPGTGPFQLPSNADGPTTWRRRQDLTMIRNEHCWRREAEPGTWNLAGMRLLFREGSAIFNALLAGEMDWLGAWFVDQLLADRPDLAKDYRKLVYDYETLGVIGILWNCDRPALADVRVRRALGMLCDRDAIVARYPGAAVRAVAFAKPDSAGYPDDIGPLPFDVGAARRLLREAGYDPANGTRLKISLLAVQDGGPMDLAVSLLQDACKSAGVELVVDTLLFSAYVAKKQRREWDGMVVNQSFRPWGDPFDFVHSKGLDNDGHWHNAEADRLAAEARGELDPDKRAALWQQLHGLVYDQQPFTFLVHPKACILFNKHIEGAVPGPRGLWPERWWVAPEHQRR